jgi:hypothetical protein
MPNPQPLNPNIILIDVRTGRLTREGFLLLQALRDKVTGQGTTAIALDDLEVAAFPRSRPSVEPDETLLPRSRPSPVQEDALPRSYAGRLGALENRIEELEAIGFRP